MITSRRKQIADAREAHQVAREEAAALTRRLARIEREIGTGLREAPRCAHVKQPCEWPSCGRAQRRAALEWALAVVRRLGGEGEAS